MLIVGNTHLADVSVSKHNSSKTSCDLHRTVHQLQSAVEALQRTEDETVPMCKRLESVNDLARRSTGELHDAVVTTCVHAMTRFVCPVVMMLCDLYCLLVEYKQ